MRIWKKRVPPSPEQRLSRDAVMSLVVHFFYQFGASMSGLFLNLYLWRLTEDLRVSAWFNLLVFAVSPPAFALAGKIAKQRGCMVVYRLGIALTALFYLIVLVSRERVVDAYPLFGLMAGFSGAFYWAAYLTLMYDVSTNANRVRYLGYNNIAFTAAGLIAPVVAGWIIAASGGLSGYMLVFAVAFMMYALSAAGSFRIRGAESRKQSYYLKYTVPLMRRSPLWLKSLYGFWIFGLLQGLMLFLPNILLYRAIPDEEAVGYVTAACSLVTIAASYAIARRARERAARAYLWAGAGGFTLAAAPLLAAPGEAAAVVAFMLTHAVCGPLFGNTLSTYYYRLMGGLPLKGQFRIESIVVRETFVNAGRVVSIFAMIVAAPQPDSPALVPLLAVVSLAQFGLGYLVDRHGAVDLRPYAARPDAAASTSVAKTSKNASPNSLQPPAN